MSERREIFAANDGSGAVWIVEQDGEVWVTCSDADSAGCELTRGDLIALRDKLTEWIGDERDVFGTGYSNGRIIASFGPSDDGQSFARRTRQASIEPCVTYATVREADDDEIDVECRFDDGRAVTCCAARDGVHESSCPTNNEHEMYRCAACDVPVSQFAMKYGRCQECVAKWMARAHAFGYAGIEWSPRRGAPMVGSPHPSSPKAEPVTLTFTTDDMAELEYLREAMREGAPITPTTIDGMTAGEPLRVVSVTESHHGEPAVVTLRRFADEPTDGGS